MKTSFKVIIGVLLMALSIAGVWFWETRGRDMVLTTEVLVAARDIAEGEAVTADCFSFCSVPKNMVISGGLTAAELSSYAGSYFSHSIKAKQQISALDFKSENLPAAGQAYFFIPFTWVNSRSLYSCEGKQLSFYSVDSHDLIGTYYVAMERSEGLEIVCTLAQYWELYGQIESCGMSSLLLVLQP